MSKYEDTIITVFENKLESGYSTEEDIPFDREDLRSALDELDINVRNVPDIPYAYRSRRKLPGEIGKHGYNAIILDDSREGADATYLFTKKKQLIPIPDTVDEVKYTSKEELPKLVRPYIQEGEQAVLTQIRYAGLINDFTGLRTYHLQSHARMRVNNREAELDDLYIGVDGNGEHHAIAVEAKGKQETLNKNQLIRNTRGIEQKEYYPDSVFTLAVKLDENGHFYLFEFEIQEGTEGFSVEKERVWKYIFDEKKNVESSLTDFS